jgi:hypothetical protein
LSWFRKGESHAEAVARGQQEGQDTSGLVILFTEGSRPSPDPGEGAALSVPDPHCA